MTESLFVSTVVIAIVDFLKRLKVKDYIGSSTIVLAAIVGGLAGYFGIEHLTIVSGLLAGLAAVGIVTTAKTISGK